MKNRFFIALLAFISFFVYSISAQTVEKLVILGGGPAGLTAAIYAARADLSPLLIEGPVPGGQLVTTHLVDNFPGFPEGILGDELIERMHQQAERFGTRFQTGFVVDVDLSQRPFKLIFEDKSFIHCEALIIALGASAKWLGLKSETALRGNGVSACATCDGFFFRGRPVVVVGGGDAALENALTLAKHASEVTVIHRKRELRASKYLQEQAFSNEKIRFIWDSIVEEILDVNDQMVSGVVLRNLTNQKLTVYPCEGVFIAIGHHPRTEMFRGKLDMDELGYLITNPKTSQTSVKGVFAAGDIADSHYRQGVTAAATGCMSAMDADHFLRAKIKEDEDL